MGIAICSVATKVGLAAAKQGMHSASKIGRNDFQYVACDVGKNVRDRSTDNTETTCGKKITFPVEPKPLLYSSALLVFSCFYPACAAAYDGMRQLHGGGWV